MLSIDKFVLNIATCIAGILKMLSSTEIVLKKGKILRQINFGNSGVKHDRIRVKHNFTNLLIEEVVG